MTEHHLDTPGPVELYVETGSGTVIVHTLDTLEAVVSITGRDVERVRVEQSGTALSVIAPRRSGFRPDDASLAVVVTVPLASEVAVRTGSADVTLRGALGAAWVRSGSGAVQVQRIDGVGVIDTGSGDVDVHDARGDLRVKSGSGRVRVGHAGATLAVSTGSGDVEIESTAGPAVVKTGSGDVHVADVGADLTSSSGSGDLVLARASRGRLTLRGSSSDVRVGVPAGTPVWTDVLTRSGGLHHDLAGTGEPEAGVDHLELRVRTGTGDVVLHRVQTDRRGPARGERGSTGSGEGGRLR